MNTLKLLFAIYFHPLNQSGRITALMRYLRWQFSARLIGAPIAMAFVDNTRLLSYLGSPAATLNIYFGLAEYEEMSFLLHVLDKQDLFLDIGSNIGSYSILASGVIGAKSMAIEPSTLAFSNLLENIRLNSLEEKIIPIKTCISDQAETLSLTKNCGPMNHVLYLAGDTNVEQVEAITLDDLIKDDAPFLIKIDVEGYEKKVLEGGMKVLECPSLNVIIVEDNGFGERYGSGGLGHIHKILDRKGFKPYKYLPKERMCISANQGQKSGNLIYIKNKQLIDQRLDRDQQYFICQARRFI